MIYLTYRLIHGTKLTFKYGTKMMLIPLTMTKAIYKISKRY